MTTLAHALLGLTDLLGTPDWSAEIDRRSTPRTVTLDVPEAVRGRVPAEMAGFVVRFGEVEPCL